MIRLVNLLEDIVIVGKCHRRSDTGGIRLDPTERVTETLEASQFRNRPQAGGRNVVELRYGQVYRFHVVVEVCKLVVVDLLVHLVVEVCAVAETAYDNVRVFVNPLFFELVADIYQ